jgi:hypothetical protein
VFANFRLRRAYGATSLWSCGVMILLGNSPLDYGSPNLIVILSAGSASCRIVVGIMHYTISGGRATFDKETKCLAIKFSLFDPSWHVDEPPHQTSDGSVMEVAGK